MFMIQTYQHFVLELWQIIKNIRNTLLCRLCLSTLYLVAGSHVLFVSVHVSTRVQPVINALTSFFTFPIF